MSETYESLLASAEISESTLEDQGNQSTPQQNEAADTKSNKETNITDPKVCHDPLFQSEGIARLNTSEAKTWMMDGELSSNNPGSPGSDLLMDGVQYPLLVINDRNMIVFCHQ